ncbi:MAG TPA: glycosyltransferase family 9 protein [Bacteroidales bacterium]|nr:glycosyltransferase family 9 protein [Bacteroidales bacterium]
MKKAIVTLCVGDSYKLISNYSHPTIKKYADKIGADFIVYNEHISDPPHYEKLIIIYDLLKKYDRLLWLDTDLIVRDDCPNLFEIVSSKELGIFNEAPYTDRIPALMELNKLYNQNFETGTYYNTGVMVLSKIHRNVFYPVTEIPFIQNSFGEQTFLNYRILKDDLVKVHKLNYRLNRMSCMDEFTGENRLSSYIVHYAGCPLPALMVELMRKDLEGWEKGKPDYKYKRSIFVQVGGGMGDQLCAEPVLRFIRKWYPKDSNDIYVTTHWPRLFEHLKDDFVVAEKFQTFNDVSLYRMETAPNENQLIWQFISHPLVHATDFASLATLRRTIPDIEKQIKLEVYDHEIEEVKSIYEKPEELILVHPGRGWKSKTFPIEWWLAVINGLINEGYKVGIIGKHIGDDQGYVDVKCPKGAVDFRDMLSIGGLIALISMSPIVVTNDSSPVHIAGAFDNWIVLIPTCKHPDHVLPYRKGSKSYKTLALYKRLTTDDIESLPTTIDGASVDIVPGDILDYIPEPEEVVKETINIIKREV